VRVIQALVPLKDLVEAKSRLSGLLRPSERRALAQAMAEDVLSVLRDHARVGRITLVSDDPGASMLAQKYGADCWPERRLGCSGLNPLIECATRQLLAARDEPLMVLHADLPMLGEADIDAALGALQVGVGLVIGCDREARGTNLLLFDSRSVPAFSFGVDSCALHMDSARRAGIRAKVLHSPGIALDVDAAPDLRHLMQRLSSRPDSHTARLLHDTVLGRRVGTTLAEGPGHGKRTGDGSTG
jgi:2-phospho-L-lactate guanylyltransferase